MTAETGRNGATDFKNEKKKVVVVGDWVFDEIWVTGEHRAAASLIGSEHLRALHHHDTSLYGLANAGKTAALLYQGLKEDEEYQISGIGVWDYKDTDAINAFLDLGSGGVHQSQYRISRPVTSNCNAQLFNLGKLVEKKLEQDKPPYRCGTMRAIRFYRHIEDRLERQKRIDWDPPFPKEETV